MKAVAYQIIDAVGNSIEELEADAFEKAHKLFGDVFLEVYEDYQVVDMDIVAGAETKYIASISISPWVPDEEEKKTSDRKYTHVDAEGDNIAELEEDARRKARLFFGEDAEVEVTDKYGASKTRKHDNIHTKIYYADSLTVYLVKQKASQ